MSATGMAWLSGNVEVRCVRHFGTEAECTVGLLGGTRVRITVLGTVEPRGVFQGAMDQAADGDETIAAAGAWERGGGWSGVLIGGAS